MLQTLKDIAAGVRGSDGTVTINKSQRRFLAEHKVKLEGKDQPNGGLQVDCQVLCKAVLPLKEEEPAQSKDPVVGGSKDGWKKKDGGK